MADVKWSDNTSFPIGGALLGTDYIMGLTSGPANQKWTTSTVLNYINANAQITESQVTNLVADLASKLNLTGGTMTGNLILNADPTFPFQAATKQYVDNSVTSLPYVLRAGDTMTGNLIINADLSIGTSTNNAPLTVQTSGGTAYDASLAAYFGSVVGATGGNFYQISIAKGSYEAIICGINKDSTTGNIPANYAYFSTFSSAGGLAFAQGDNTGLPSLANILINGSGQINIQNSLNIGTQIITNNALLQLNSITKGFMPSIWTSANESTNIASLGSSDAGLQWFNSDISTDNYWDGSQVQQILTIQNVDAGTNITLDKSVPGKVTINASGGITPPSAAYASFSVLNNTVVTTFAVTSTFYPVYLGNSFSGNDSSDFTNQFLTISGNLTPVMTYGGATTQFFNVNINLSCRGAVPTASNYTFSVFIRLANGTVVPTQYRNTVGLQDLINILDASMTANVQLNTGDSVFVEVENITGTNSLYVAYATYSITSIAGSIANTNGLSQGSSNIYLSQNGGTTYQYLSGSATVGNLPMFSSLGGQLIDSGIASSGVITSTDQIVAITQVSGTTQVMTDNAPINRYILQNTSTCTLTLPTSIMPGHSFEIIGGRAADWIIAQNSGQSIALGANTTTAGPSGSLSSTNFTDSLTLTCTTANTQLTAHGVQGNITYI